MAVKYYVYGIESLLKHVQKYLTKWAENLHRNVTADQWACLEAVLAAVNAALICLATWNPPVE